MVDLPLFIGHLAPSKRWLAFSPDFLKHQLAIGLHNSHPPRPSPQELPPRPGSFRNRYYVKINGYMINCKGPGFIFGLATQASILWRTAPTMEKIMGFI